MKAWHFAANNRRLGYKDGRKIVKGRTLQYTGKRPIELCRRGMHASLRILDALEYAPGDILCRVDLSGDIICGEDKLVAEARTCLWWLDVTPVLWEFSCWCVEKMLPVWERYYPSDKRPHQAIAARRDWLAGKISDAELYAACLKCTNVSGIRWDINVFTIADAAGLVAARAPARVVARSVSKDMRNVLTSSKVAGSTTKDKIRVAQNRKLTAIVMGAYNRIQK